LTSNVIVHSFRQVKPLPSNERPPSTAVTDNGFDVGIASVISSSSSGQAFSVSWIVVHHMGAAQCIVVHHLN
jgi:hypothetical protein